MVNSERQCRFRKRPPFGHRFLVLGSRRFPLPASRLQLESNDFPLPASRFPLYFSYPFLLPSIS